MKDKRKVYFDNCSLQRPLDDKSQIRIRIEAEAILGIIEFIEEGKLNLISSSVLEMELKRTPDMERISFGYKVLSLSDKSIKLSNEIICRQRNLSR